jgi:DNA adenine methylase
MEVFGSDIFNPLVTFWQVLLNNQDELVRRVRKYYPLTRTKFYYLQKIYLTLTDEIEMAAVFFVLNRSSFSGTTLSGGMSPDHPRFTESAIERLQDFHADNFHVQQADYRDVIPLHSNDFLYLDPPYLNGEALYGDRGNTHKGFDHDELAELLVGRERWIMSYNDCTEIRTLYKKNQILSLDWVYGMSKDKKSSEVLILSRDLAA